MDFRERKEVLNRSLETESSSKADVHSREEGRKSAPVGGKSSRKNSKWRKKPSLGW